MNILRRLDAWLGMTLFHPPIILLCQMTRQSQYAIYRAFWFLAACHATYYTMTEGAGWGWTIFLWVWTASAFINATVHPDREATSWGGFRFMLWCLLAMGIAASIIAGSVTQSTVRNLIMLFAEYAATIRTIPPRRKRERRSSAKEAFNGN